MIQHRPYDYLLSPKMKCAIKGMMYNDIKAIKVAVTKVVNTIQKPDMQKSIQAFVDHVQQMEHILNQQNYFCKKKLFNPVR